MAAPRSEPSGEAPGNRNGRANRPPARSGESAACGMTSMSNEARPFDFCVELPFGRAHAEIAGLVNEVDRRAARGGPPDRRPTESADEERLGLVLGNVGRGALDPLESRFDIQQRKFACNRSARFGAKGTGVRDLARRDAMGLLREVIAPEPYTVARRQVVR